MVCLTPSCPALFTAPAQRRLNSNRVKCELTEQDNGAEHVRMVSGQLTQNAGDD